MKSFGTRAAVSIATLSALLFLFAACASGPRLRHKHEYTLAPGNEHHPALAKVLLVPLDYTNEEPVRGLDVANDRIMALLVSHLESKQIEVEQVDPARFDRIADAAYETVLAERKSGASGVASAQVEFDDVVPLILEKLDRSPDLVVAPNLVMRTAAYQGRRTIAWDGVRRRESVYESRMSGKVPAASLQVAVYARDGTRAFSGYGGLEPVFRVDTTLKKYVQREDLFQDERNLREAICVAFYPYFGMDEYCAQ